MRISHAFQTSGNCLRTFFQNKGLEYDLKFQWIKSGKNGIPPEIGNEEPDDKETDFKEKLKNLLKS